MLVPRSRLWSSYFVFLIPKCSKKYRQGSVKAISKSKNQALALAAEVGKAVLFPTFTH